MESVIDQQAFSSVFITCLAIVCLSPFLLPLALVVFRGRGMGFLKCTRRLQYAGVSPDEILRIFTDRLRFEGFEIKHTEPGRMVRAVRSGAVHIPNNPLSVFKHAGLPLAATITVTSEGSGTTLSLLLKYREFIVADTGEGQYLNLLAERLVSADLQQQAPPMVANPSMNLSVSLFLSCLMMAGALLALTPLFTASHCLGLLLGYAIALVVIAILLVLGSFTAWTHPGEISGLKMVVPALVLSVTAMLLVVGVASTRHRQILTAEWHHIQAEQQKKLAKKTTRHPVTTSIAPAAGRLPVPSTDQTITTGTTISKVKKRL